MKIKDKIYGELEIEEPVILELVNSKNVRRLKNLSMVGLPQEYWHKPIFSRYEHSIGVFLLLRKLGAEIEEQVAGLLHDVSHTAFSHVVDWVLGDRTKEDFQDSIHSETIRNSNIPKVLDKYGIDSEKISKLDKFSLLDSNIPDLCVDRFDYAIREIIRFEALENIDLILKTLSNLDGKLVFTSQKAAEIFSRGFLKCQAEHWGGEESKARYHLLADALKYALNQGILSEKDFRKTDFEVLEILNNTQDEKIERILIALKTGIKVVEDEAGFSLPKKIRYVDPQILLNSQIIKLSEISEEYRAHLDNFIQKQKAFKKIKILI